MPRKARLLPPEGCLHVISRGNNRQDVFRSSQDFDVYYDRLLQRKKENEIEIYHYCLLNNHVHLILYIYKDSSVARFMKQVNLSYYHYFKKKNDYSGHLWQGRFKHSIIDTDRYLFQCGKYIELNPVRAGIVNSPEEYPYSSYGYYANGRQDPLLTENRLYVTLGPNLEQRQEQYRTFVIDSDIKKRLTNDRFIGTPEFVSKFETI